MYRSMMQALVKNSDDALEFYKKAFDAKVLCAYHNEGVGYMHAELDIFGQVLAVTETEKAPNPGNTMMFCLHMGEGHEAEIYKAYEVLKDGATIISPPNGDCGYSPLQFNLVDKFGVWWCMFI